jgi:hypothetical protein
MATVSLPAIVISPVLGFEVTQAYMDSEVTVRVMRGLHGVGKVAHHLGHLFADV